ncbi:MAG TPA: Na+/H+ antiporter subunit E [Bacteroidales bacterium]|nr:Na+/H+ antiporter subunit E [Bacteroidales bacterium]
MIIKRFLISFLVFLAVWLLLTSSLQAPSILVGVVVSLIIALLFGIKAEVFGEIKLSLKAIINLIAYTFVFIWELIKSNIDVALRVLNPSLPINPGIVKVKTRLKSKTGRMVLANSITLTPGTLSIDIKDEFLYVHWIDVKDCDLQCATEEIVKKFEKYLEVIYG